MTSAASSHLEHLSKAAIRLIDYGVSRVWYETAFLYSGFYFIGKKSNTFTHSLFWVFSKICFHLWIVRTHLEVKGILDNNMQGRSILIFFGTCSSIGSLSTPPLCLLPYISCWPSVENLLWYSMRRVAWVSCAIWNHEKSYMDISWMSKDISKPGVKIWHLKSPVINIGLGRFAEFTVRMREAFLVLMHMKTQRYTFH